MGVAMRKKHFEALAAAIRCTRIDFPEVGEDRTGPSSDVVLNAAAERMATVCASFNAKFDRARFLKACGVEA